MSSYQQQNNNKRRAINNGMFGSNNNNMTTSCYGSTMSMSMMGAPSRKKLKTKATNNTTTTNSKKSVTFSPHVNQRTIVILTPQGSASSSSSDQQQAAGCSSLAEKDFNIKLHAKALCKLHRLQSSPHQGGGANSHATPNSHATASIAETIRFEIRGESLRGMEHITNISIGRKRRRIQREAIASCINEQQEQLVEAVLDGYLSGNDDDNEEEDTIASNVVSRNNIIDRKNLATVYGAKAREAFAYAKRIGGEDAKVAKEILDEDLPRGGVGGRMAPPTTAAAAAASPTTMARTLSCHDARMARPALSPTMARSYASCASYSSLLLRHQHHGQHANAMPSAMYPTQTRTAAGVHPAVHPAMHHHHQQQQQVATSNEQQQLLA
eukprot:CAMPEP_0183712148 /NCGR_PEP_ID=MMETSP0737-20130205/7370_1 /TAXON_ID=385413 /ORGANISM="Thalassiosira miniscula, Strain CCMP1093" /LENGTH=381 /DNA_ID=CAMNT_0025940727 /DNA_START=49 /DNA_END=1191 /DNA_ORIENTATION=-